ncbi:MAG: hypothetical protein EU549_02730 [Promethearchaeota archaeon]|nr:MAG: hypothetical protein EU549_02730 [Candidatus Lokiarchaeota archaeon]
MVSLTLESLIIRDAILILQVFAVFILFYLSYQVGKRIKEASKLSATTGLFFYFIGMAIHQMVLTPDVFYLGNVYNPPSLLYGNLILTFSMAVFVIFTEIEKVKKTKKESNIIIKYPLSVISLISVLISSIFTFIPELPFIPTTAFWITLDIIILVVFIFVLVILVIISTKRYFKRFKSLEIVKQTKAIPIFNIGISIAAGISNSFISLWAFLGEYTIIFKAFTVVIGGFLMVKSWQKLPRLSELDWVLELDRLMVIHRDASSVLFEYEFQASSDKKQKNQQIDGDIAGTAIGGIAILLKEILTSKDQIHVIDHGDKKIYFSHGSYILGVLIVQGSSEEFQYRLNLFSLIFEKKYEDILKNYTGKISEFKSSRELIPEVFTG